MIIIEDINVIYVDMPPSIKAYTVNNPDCTYTIVLNSRLSMEQHMSSYRHELLHIMNGDYEKKCSVDIIEINARNR